MEDGSFNPLYTSVNEEMQQIISSTLDFMCIKYMEIFKFKSWIAFSLTGFG